MNKFMGKEIGAQMQTNLLCFSLYFSIFFCGCKQPKSIHIKSRAQRYEKSCKRTALFAKKCCPDCKLEEKDAHEGSDEAHAVACQHLPEIVLAQQQSAAAYEAGNQNAYAEPPEWVEKEYQAVGYKSANNSSCSCGMHRDFPFRVD